MISIQDLKKDLPGVAAALQRRGVSIDQQQIAEIVTAQKEAKVVEQTLQAERNRLSKLVGELHQQPRTDDTAARIESTKLRTSEIKQLLAVGEARMVELDSALMDIAQTLPNKPHPRVPDGMTESDNQVIFTWLPDGFDLEESVVGALPHGEVCENNNLGLDFAAGAKLSGARFTVMRGAIASLHRALGQFMLDRHVNVHGYEECSVPYIVNGSALVGTGQLPKFADDMYRVSTGDDNSHQYLIPTGEVPLTNLVADTIVDAASLPVKLTALTPCFRSEAGSSGRDVRGLIRQHQFDKVELVRISKADQSDQSFDEMIAEVGAILQALQLPHRVVALCAGDMGFSAAYTYDFEVWMPSQNTWREISSVSNCGDFQARRMGARTKVDGKIELVHTLNGSGVAVGRALAAIIENGQGGDKLSVPEVLRSYLPASASNAFVFV